MRTIGNACAGVGSLAVTLGLGWIGLQEPERDAPAPAGTEEPSAESPSEGEASADELRAWIEAAEAERAANGSGPAAAELERAELRIAQLEAELARERTAWEAERRDLVRRHEVELATLADRIAFESGAGSIRDPWDEIRRLRVELAREREARFERESDWLDWSQALTALAPDGLALPEFTVEVPAVPEFTFGPEPPPEPAVTEREEQVTRSLRTLLAVEEVAGLDLLDAGRLGDGWIGPVLFRLIDARGRLAGSLYAERLRLEGSRAGRSLTIVLEDGYEAHKGVRVAFDPAAGDRAGSLEQGGVRRIALPHVDPMPWIKALPELFGDAELGRGSDDGLWNVERVRRTLNRLCAEDAAHGYPRFKAIGGVRDGVLRDVHVESLDADGWIERRLFADRVTLKLAFRGVEILCEDGVHVRGDDKAAFLDGRYRLFLPRADAERWKEALLPGLVPETEADFFATDDG